MPRTDARRGRTREIFCPAGRVKRWQRRAVAPIFRHETLLSFVPIFANMAQRQVDCWRAARAVPIDAAAAMTRTTFEIIVEAMLGGSASLDAERYRSRLDRQLRYDPVAYHLRHVFDPGMDALSAPPSGNAVSRFSA